VLQSKNSLSYGSAVVDRAHFYASASYGRRRLLRFHYVPLSQCLSSRPDVRCPVPKLAFCSLRTSTEQISMKFGGSGHYHQQMNWLAYILGEIVPGTMEQEDTTEDSNRRQTGVAINRLCTWMTIDF